MSNKIITSCTNCCSAKPINQRWLRAQINQTQKSGQRLNKCVECVVWRARVESQFEMEKNHSRDKKCLTIEKNVNERGKFRHHYYSISFIFMHNNYLFLMFSTYFISISPFWSCRPVIYNISRQMTESTSTTQKAIKLLFLSSRWGLNSDFMEIRRWLSPKGGRKLWSDTWRRLREREQSSNPCYHNDGGVISRQRSNLSNEQLSFEISFTHHLTDLAHEGSKI